MVKVYVNNKLTYVPVNSSVLEACRSVGVEVPRFCFHERLSVAGNCRMCLVELEKAPKPVASCAMPVVNNMRVFTETPLVRKARENVLEFLLINHPLDCPICDQAGECDLQDQTMVFGSDRNRFFSFKRNVEDKNCGPLVKTIMNRCIHCTRCVRFVSDIAGAEELGTTNRGRATEIGMYLQKTLKSELSANIVDLCPVGALTSKPYAFIARPWELRSVESIDFSDSIGSNIRIDFKESEIVRILPKKNEKLNEEWITDKARYSFDALKVQRLDRPYFKDSEGNLKECSWEEAITNLTSFLSDFSPSEMGIIVSPDLGLSSLIEIKNFSDSLGVKNVGFPRDFSLNIDFSDNFLSNTLLDEINRSDLCLFIGSNPRYEAAMLNLKIRKHIQQKTFKSFSLGIAHDLTYKTNILGISADTLLRIAEGKHFLCKALKKSRNPLIFYSASLAERMDFSGLESIIKSLNKWSKVINSNSNGFCFLNQESNQVGAFNLGLKQIDILKLKTQKLCFLIGNFKEEDLNFLKSSFNSQSKIISLSSNGTSFLKESSIILPLTNFFEYEDVFMNIEGTVQKANRAVLSNSLNKNVLDIFFLIKSNLSRKILPKSNSFGKEIFFFISKTELDLSFFCLNKKTSLDSSLISKYPFYPYVTDFYTAGSLSEFSKVMAKCSFFYRYHFNNFINSP